MLEFAIETINLSKRFYPAKDLHQLIFDSWKRPRPILVVDKVNLRIKSGELFALVGPNGAGKTTLIKMLTGLILPTEGIARVNGLDIIRDEMQIKGSIGLLTSEERSFYWRLTGRENLNFFASLYNFSKTRARDRISELAGLLEIEGLDRRFQEYSGGMKQRIAIARSLLNDPQVVFMDEPTKNLDPLAAEGLRNFIKDELVKNQGKTVLFCTHNLTEAAALGGSISIMDKGKIRACGTLEELRKNAGLSLSANIEDIFKSYVAQ
ncbi:MAG: ABC transporter ATP-binding protein [Candidatus Omnitrophica bacterium]|nr:ABC transporter ATP-binding protein [Candidatus Omnitrophota bacterium]